MGGTSTSHTSESEVRTAAGRTNGKDPIISGVWGFTSPAHKKKRNKRTNYGLAFDQKEDGDMKDLRLKFCGRGMVPDGGSGALSPRKIVCCVILRGGRKIG